MPRRWKQSSRRKQSSSAFEFTGEEALAAERAFKQRNPMSLRKPKISVTSISPRSTINKLLLSRTSKPSSNNTPKPPTSKNSRSSTKPTAVVKKPATKQEETLAPTLSSHTGEAVEPPASVPSPDSTPSRRSLRKRLPSFKLRASSSLHQPHSSHAVPLRVRIRTASNDSNDPSSNEPNEPLDKPLSRDVLSGHPQNHQTKRPRERCPGADDDADTVVPKVKKSRANHDTHVGASNSDPEHMRGTRSDDCSATGERMTGACAVTHPAGLENGIENRRVDQKGCVAEETGSKNVELPTVDQPTTNPDIEIENPAMDVAEQKPCIEETGMAAEISPTDTKSFVEEPRSEEATPPNDSNPFPEQEHSTEESTATDRCQTTEVTIPDSSNLFESTVVSLKPEAEVGLPHMPAEALPTNRQPRDIGQDEGVAISKQDKNKNSGSMPPGSAGSTPEKLTAAPAHANRTTSEQELQKHQDIVPEESDTTPAEIPPISAQGDAEEIVVSRTAAPITAEQKLESDQITPGPTPADKIKGPAERKHEAHVHCEESSSPNLGQAKCKSPPKPTSGAMKRVRFTEPTQYRSSEKKLGFSGIMKMRRRRVHRPRALDGDFSDVSVVAAGTKGPDEKGRHLLLDELQYLLDGIFKTGTNGGKKGQTADNEVVASSLQSLIKLLLRRSKTSGQSREDGEDDDCGELVKILVEQPDLLKTIVKRLCAVLGKSRASDALLALVFVIILRATPKILLLTEHELDLLLNAFFRNSAASLKESEPDAEKRDGTKDDTMDKEPQARRRGKLGRVFDQKKPKEDILAPLLKLMTEADVIEENCSAFKRETEAASHLMGVAISLILSSELETREWMRDNRRLDKVVAVLYSCEKMMRLQLSKEADQTVQSLHNIEERPSWIVMEASLRILEFAVLDKVCQQRLAQESRVSAIIINLLKTIKSIKTGPLESEWMICGALRLCINLCHGCHIASRQLVDENGHNVVLNWLVKECFAAGLLQNKGVREDDKDIDESFDVRVLCLAVLASTVNQEKNVCNSFHEMQADGMEKRERGAISLVLDILRTAELEAKKEESKESIEEDEGGSRRRRTTRQEDAEKERRAQFVMERKITIGYVCLLIGALACDSKSNRDLIQDLLPGKSFIGVAAVLAEFLEFHHEVGVISGSMNRMYGDIIKKIVEPEAEKEKKVSVVEAVEDDMGKALGVGTEAHDDLDLLLQSPDIEDGDIGADEEVQFVDEAAEAGCEMTTLATPVGRRV